MSILSKRKLLQNYQKYFNEEGLSENDLLIKKS